MSFCFRWRKKKLRRLMNLSKSFIWEDMSEGMSTLLPTAKKLIIRCTIGSLIIHYLGFVIQQLISDHPVLSIDGYYPVDWSTSPMYEIINLSQV